MVVLRFNLRGVLTFGEDKLEREGNRTPRNDFSIKRCQDPRAIRHYT